MCALKTSSRTVRHPVLRPGRYSTTLPPRHADIPILAERGNGNPVRHIELDIDIGADAKDWNAIQNTEKLKPVEAELRRLEEVVGEIVSEMEYLRSREMKLRDTNESTNERVKWFAFGTMGMLVGLGAWQVVYLRAYFRYVFSQVPLQVLDADSSGPDRSISSSFRVCDALYAALRRIGRVAVVHTRVLGHGCCAHVLSLFRVVWTAACGGRRYRNTGTRRYGEKAVVLSHKNVTRSYLGQVVLFCCCSDLASRWPSV